MPQNKEATQFLSRIAMLPKGNVSLDAVLQPSLDDEADLRKLFATDKRNARLKDIHAGLVDIFAAPSDIRTTRARVVTSDSDRDAQHVMALSDALRRKEGSAAMVDSLEAFKKNWSVFTENSLSQLFDWSNVIAAGGSVQACLMPLPKAETASKRAMRKYYHEKAFPSSDVDLFLYGLTRQEAERKIISIYEAVRDSVPWDVTCVRTKHTISILSQYPYRSVQIVLRLYSSPAEILAGFDVDVACCAYDGDRVWANPRAIVSMMRQSNTVDMTRRSPSYEVRLAKYSSRGFEVYIPGLKRSKIDPTIYERAVSRVQGLARLLAIEKLATPEIRNQYRRQRSVLRGHNYSAAYTRPERRYKSDLKADAAFSGLELSDYDVINLHVPYGPEWDARRIEKLIYKTDFGVNSPYNPKNKDRHLHRHYAFFGTMEECMEDCCEHCPEPRNAEEHILQDEEDKSYVRGRILFIEEDPGRQSVSGSFNPIDEGEWSETAYIQATAKFFGAISKNDTITVTRMIEDGEDVNHRDHVGRTPLHVAIISNSVESANILIDAGARMTTRLVGGRTSFHLAAQTGQTSLVKKMLARSAYNEAKSVEEKLKAEETEENLEVTERVRMSSEDDWSSESDDGKAPQKASMKSDTEKDPDPLEDDKKKPDILDISNPDWDFGITPLGYAILSGSLEVVDVLLVAGADPNHAGRAKDADPLHPLTLTIYTQDEEHAARIAERLVAAQAISSTADKNLLTIFHRMVVAGRTKIVMSLLNRDPNAKKVLDFPAWAGLGLVFPLVSSVLSGDYATLSVLVAYGAKLVYSPEDASRALRANRRGPWSHVHSPVGVALTQHDEVISLLIALGATVDVFIDSPNVNTLQWVSAMYKKLRTPNVPRTTQEPPVDDTWAQYNAYLAAVLPTKEEGGIVKPQKARSAAVPHLDEEHALAMADYYARVETILHAYSVMPQALQSGEVPTSQTTGQQHGAPQRTAYNHHIKYGSKPIPAHLKVFYDELYEACWTGDNATVQELCLPKNLKESKEPIQISVLTMVFAGPFHSPFVGWGWTPFLVALHRRHWETARLVIAIAMAQYQASGPPFDPIVDILSDDEDDSEKGFYDSDEDSEEDDSQRKEIDFVDLAARPSAIRAEVSAKKMLETKSLLLRVDGKRIYYNPLQKTIEENDFEGFVCALELYKFAGVALWPEVEAHGLVVKLDRPDMLDELTRRTGVGIPYPSNTAKNPHANLENAAEERVYLGLKVGGKWHAKTKKQMQEEHKGLTYNYDLLRNAIALGATKVIEYLAGPRVLAAYTDYAAAQSDDIAQYLKSVDNLETALPGLLGWQIDELNESPVLCAVIHNKLDILKQLIALKPNLMEEALHKRTKFVGVTALLAAASYCSSTEIVDFLLEKGCDPSERDARGWNIYHLACLSQDSRGVKFVIHLLKTLSIDLTHELMAQTSKEALNTPLMLAVKRECATTARAILDFGVDPAVILRKDAGGSTPLHIAVQNTNTAIVGLLLQYGPTEQLYTENSVGQTPLDIASLKNLPRLTAPHRRPYRPHANIDHQLCALKNAAPFNVEKQKVEIPKLRATLDALFADGRLVHDTKLATELLAFAGYMESKLAIEMARTSAAGKDTEGGDGNEVNPVAPQGTTASTYALLRDAVAARPGHRQLVHLTDVQHSVKRYFTQAEKALSTSSRRIPKRDEETKEVDPEEQRIVALKSRSMFGSASTDPRVMPYKHLPYLFDEDRF